MASPIRQWQWPPSEPQAAPDDQEAPREVPWPTAVLAPEDDLKKRLHQKLIQELDLAKLDALPVEKAREAVEAAARTLIARDAPAVVGTARDELVEALRDEVLGLGPIDGLVHDPSISEVMVNGPTEVFFEREGRLYRSEVRFRDRDHIVRIVERIVAPLGRRVDEASPMVDARLPDGSRVNVIIPPIALRSPTVTIRKFRADRYAMPDLVQAGTLSPELVELLRAVVQAKLNILISGGTGAGKTTLLNALSAFIPNSERVVTIEDPAELRLQQAHVVTLEARPPSIEGRGQVTQRDLVRNALRMRPDRIIVGEVRGAEAFDMLQAMNTGHEGSISTVHSNSPRDALSRLENMVLMAGFDLPVRAIREQVTSALHLMVHIARFPDGVRRVTHATEVVGLEGDTVTMQDVFLFLQEGVDAEGRVRGALLPTGLKPGFAERFRVMGVHIPPDLFVRRGV